jgi:hypothetical protein
MVMDYLLKIYTEKAGTVDSRIIWSYHKFPCINLADSTLVADTLTEEDIQRGLELVLAVEKWLLNIKAHNHKKLITGKR